MSERFAKDILARMREGDPAALSDLIAFVPPDPPDGFADALTVIELIKEARGYALRGDLRECEFRLRLAAEPKWTQVAACAAPYARAMEETRAARARSNA